MEKVTKDVKRNELLKAIQGKIDIRIVIYLIVGAVLAVFFLIEDYWGKEKFLMCEYIRYFFKYLISVCGEEAFELIKAGSANYCNLVMTLDTILAAAVIFFYSVQDSRREGIPHRIIMGYAFGPFTVPGLFFLTIVLLPIIYILLALEWNWTLCILLLYTYGIQMIILGLILMSTSYQYSIHAVCNVEIRQFRVLDEIDKREKVTGKDGTVSIFQDASFIWTYLLHHMEQVAVSDDSTSEKMRLARRILRVPYYRAEIRTWDEVLDFLFERRKNSKLCLDQMKMKTNSLKRTYSFYYQNILVLFQNIRQEERTHERNMMYMVLYEFIEELARLYRNAVSEKEIDNDSREKYQNTYLMTISGIMNGVLDSNVVEAEAFCNYVLNNIEYDEEHEEGNETEDAKEEAVNYNEEWKQQIDLYVLFQEFLYRTNPDAIKLNDINGIYKLEKWENQVGDKWKFYAECWEIWIGFTTISKANSNYYFCLAIDTLNGEGYDSIPVAYVKTRAERLKRRENASQSNTTGKQFL